MRRNLKYLFKLYLSIASVCYLFSSSVSLAVSHVCNTGQSSIPSHINMTATQHNGLRLQVPVASNQAGTPPKKEEKEKGMLTIRSCFLWICSL
jgi:hypothetical protein